MICIGGPIAGRDVEVDSYRLLIPTLEIPSAHALTGPEDPVGYYDDVGQFHGGSPLPVRTHGYEVTRVLMYVGEEA